MKNREFIYKLFRPIAEDNRLTPCEKKVAMYIYTYVSNKQKCTASNTHMAKMLYVSTSKVDEAMIKLQYLGMVNDLRSDPDYGYIEVCSPQICKANFYQVSSIILESKLLTSTKFLLVYILSYENKGKVCYSTNANIKNHIGLGKDAIGAAMKELKGKGWLYVVNAGKPERELKLHTDKDPLAELRAEANNKAVSSSQESEATSPENSLVSPKIRKDIPEISTNKVINNYSNKERDNKRSNNIVSTYSNVSDTSLITEEQLDIFLEETLPTDYWEYDEETTPTPPKEVQLTSFLIDGGDTAIQPQVEITESQLGEEIKEDTTPTFPTGSVITIDDLIIYTSNMGSHSQEFWSKDLQEAGIGTGETIPSTTYGLLQELGNLSYYLNEEKKLMFNYHKGRHYLVNLESGRTDLEIKSPPFGYDSRMFQEVHLGKDGMHNVSGFQLKMGSSGILIQAKSGQIQRNKYRDYHFDDLNKLDRFNAPYSLI